MRHNFSIAQCLFNDGSYSAEQIQQLLLAAEQDESVVARMLADDEVDNRPVRTAVLQALGDRFSEESGMFCDYMELFVDSLRDFMHMEAVVGMVSEVDAAWCSSYAVSQSIHGDVNLTIGLSASADVYLELARRYSQEEMAVIDDLTVDSVEEFLNVVNGLFCIELANQKTEAELDIPHSDQGVDLSGTHGLCLQVYTSIGAFQAILMADAFLEVSDKAEGPVAGILF